ncbi:GNAT family N-acetyltransferase [Kitasatospora sp. NPDC058965]|uniref:GNAT family N-acetyltransferase n=1 Tax=Kitasatospora sp. NPDC058965 TaxID=3346682 RepID=UPI003683C62A
MDSVLQIRPARPEEAGPLSELALRSKGHWGYDEAFLAACRAELTLRPALLAAGRALVAERGGAVLGFALFGGHELDMLYVEPAAIGQGVGSALFRAVLELARAAGTAEFTVDADPNAADFYRAMGARRTGEVPSGSIPGRVLPQFTVTVAQTPAAPSSEPAA